MKLEHRKIILLGIFLLVVPFVLSANVIENIIAPLGLENIPGLYLKYPTFFDAIFYFMFFIGISLAGLGRIEMFQNSKLVPVTVGIILALAMSVFAYNRFSLIGDLGPYALIFIILFCFFFGYKALVGMGTSKLIAFAILYLVLSAIFMFAISPLLSGTKTGQNSAVQAMSGNQAIQSVAALGNVVSWFILIGALFGLIFKRRGDGPSLSETADLNTYFPKGESAAHNIEKVDNEVAKATTDRGEKELLEEAKEETKLEEDSEVPIAEAKKTADELEAEKKVEEIKNINEEKIMNKLASDSDMINNIMNRVGDPNVDAIMHGYIKKYLKEVSNVGIALEQNQKNTIKARMELLNNILENVKKVEDVLKRTKRAEHYIAYIEKQVTKDMGQEVLKHIDKSLDDLKKAKTNSNKGWDEQIMAARAAKNVVAMNQLKQNKVEAANKIDANIRLVSINKAKIKSSLEIFIKQYTGAVDKAISEIKKIVSDQITFQQDLSKKVNDAFSDAKQYDLYIKNLEGAIEKVGGVSYRVEKEDTAGVEELIMKSQIAIEGMFMQISNINNLTIKLFSKDIKVILDYFQRLDIQSSQLGNAIDGLTKSSEQVEQQYENLKKSASFDKTGQSENITKILRAIDTMSKTSSQERQQVINQTINQINKTEADLNNELGKMTQENDRLKNTQDKVINSLKRALDTMTKIRTRETTKIENAATKMEAVAVQQAQNLNTLNQNLERVNFKK